MRKEIRKEKMVQRKKSCHVSSTANCGTKNKNGVEGSNKESNKKDTHWDFLDEIEAPMWVDLTQECHFTYQYKDDEWFHTSHMFHQCSSRELISAFSHADEGCTNLDLCVQEQYSPKIPSSVSRSRGKAYRSREWGWRNDKATTFDQQQSIKNLKNETSFVNSVADKVSSDKTSYGRPMELAVPQSDSIGKRSFTEITGQQNQSVPHFRNDNFCSNSMSSSKEGESNLTSTITSDGSEHQQQKSFEVSSQVFVQTSAFVSALKISLRRSCVTRQASRMQVTEGRKSEGRNSSSSKSSVGSSSNHGCDGKYLTGRQNNDKILGSRYVRGVTISSSDKVSVAKSAKAPIARPQDITSIPKLRSQRCGLPSINQENGKAKVQQQTRRGNVLLPHCVNKRLLPAASIKDKEKAVAPGYGRIPAGGKENAAGKVVVSQKPSTKGKATKDFGQVQKVIRRKLPEKSGKTKLVGQQQERISGGSEGNKPGTIPEKVLKII